MASENIDIEIVDKKGPSTEFQLKKYLLLLATLVATVTYVAGLNLPGGSWLEDTPGQVAGESILRETHYYRYIVFYYCNAISFAASLLVSLLLLVLQEEGDQHRLRAVMVVDLFGLMGAYAAGSSRDAFTTICASVMVFGLFAYVTVAFLHYLLHRARTPRPDQEKAPAEHEILMVLAIFAATIAYVAGMNPPGGFWRSTQEGHHTGGDPILQGGHSVRYKAFFFCNTTAFVASLLAIMLIVDYKKLNICGNEERPSSCLPLRAHRLYLYGLYGSVVVALFGLGGAYAAGSCRDPESTAYVLSLVAAVLAYIFIQEALTKATTGGIPQHPTNWRTRSRRDGQRLSADKLDKAREFIQLLAILAATITYQAGLDPPGGLWLDNGEGHTVGDSILLTTHPVRYKVFFYCNSAAFVASLVIIVMLQSEYLVRLHVLEAAMILDLFSLMGAYAAGSCRDSSTSIYIVAMAGAVLIYVVIHIIFFTLDTGRMNAKELDNYREVLLLLAILAATLTYQAGLTPPGGFWEMDDKLGHHAGFSVLQDKSPRRYKAFFYCNAASFMASVALIILLVNPNLYKPGIQCYALFVCLVGGMFGLMGAYAAGSSLHLGASIFVLVLVALVFLFVVYLAASRYWKQKHHEHGHGHGHGQEEEEQGAKSEADMANYLMLLGILAASVTYLTGLKPPGGLWRDDNNGHSAGSPILYDMDRHRYYVFFYNNSTSFMASIIVIAMLLPRIVHGYAAGHAHPPGSIPPLWPLHTAMLLDMLALLGAYAAGSARDWGTSKNVILLLFPILAFLGILFFCKEKYGVVDIPVQDPEEEATAHLSAT